ncbi:MAG TPA: DNA-binding protein YbiB [Usitatibacter sp.]|jgi:anthranilate phosphoribosyltransferase|nr:DNA-binding protein YbiB [Usitatibacter sp.]
MFDARPYLKELARGSRGARDLSREEASTLFAAVLGGEVAPAALGALMVALRVKGETPDELAGMMDALQSHVRPLEFAVRRAIPVLLPSYNGARKAPNLVPLLALLLAREDVPVVLHGTHQEPARSGSFEILAAIGHPRAASVAEAEERLRASHLAVMETGVLSPDLARLLELREVIGVRNSGHTMAKLLLPAGVAPAAACRLVSVTHPEFMKLMREHLAAAAGNAFLMRGVEGEAVARLHSPQPVEEFRADGSAVSHLLGDGEAEPRLPERDAAATAAWTRDVLEGRLPVPAALARQVALIVEHCRQAAAAGRPPLRLVSSKTD